MPDIARLEALHVGGQGFYVGRNCNLNLRMFRVIGLKFVTDLDRTLLILRVNFDEDGANLTRLDDFLEVKVACLTSAGSGAKSDGSSNPRLVWTPNRGIEPGSRSSSHSES